MKLAWGKAVKEDFIEEVLNACDELGWPAETHAPWLMTCIAFETKKQFATSVRNEQSGATGLIQFTARTAIRLGTTTEELAAMTVGEQMRYVIRYFAPCAHKVKSLIGMYLAIFAPTHIERGMDAVVYAKGTLAYEQNKGFDANGKGMITVADIEGKIRWWYERGMLDTNMLEIAESGSAA